MSLWNGVQFIADAVGMVMNLKGGGTPGSAPAPSVIGQRPDLRFARISEGLGARETAGTGRIGIDVPSRFDSKNQWINLQAKYLSYLNMAEEFEAPGKVRRAIKLKVS